MTEISDNDSGRRWNRWRIAAWSVALGLLLVPLIGMQFSDEVAWTGFDFAFAAALVIGTGIAFEIAIRHATNNAYRIAFGVALGAAFVLIWVTGAVGIIGSENNSANLMYGGVLVVGTLGALLARFRAQGMARALYAMALAQVLVPAIALVLGKVPTGSEIEVVAINAFFVALFLASAVLFRNAAEEQAALA